jgi:glycosyltransferase involved in cell wall biosynthesis
LSLLLANLRDDFEVSVLLPGQGRFTDELARLNVRVFSFPSLSKWSLPSVARLINAEDFELVYANNASSVSRIAFVAAKWNRVPFVCHVREMKWDASWPQLGYLRLADAVIAVSRACADSVTRFVRPNRLHVVYNGVPVEAFETKRKSNGLRAETGIPPSAILLLSVAHLCERKGQEYAIAAAGEIFEMLPAVHLCFVGSLTRQPAYVDRLRRLAGERGISGRVHFLGFRPDVQGILQEADILLHTATTDPHPRAVLEAMAAGLPVVGFAVDGVTETVVDGVTGRLVRTGDSGSLAAAALELANCPDTRKRMGAAGRERVQSEFASEATAMLVRDVIVDLVL